MSLSIDLFFIGASILAGTLIFFYKETPFYLKAFLFFLVYTLISELIATWLVTHGKHNTNLYNFYGVVQLIFYVYLLSNFIQNKRLIKICRIVQFSYLFLALMNVLLFQKFAKYNTITYAFGCLIIVALSIFYFFELFKQKKILNLSRESPFWISTALLFYFSCSFPIIATVNIIQNVPEIIINSIQTLLLLTNILLYSLFTIAFLCRIKIRKYILSLL